MHKTLVILCSVALLGSFAGSASGQCGAGAAGRAPFLPQPQIQISGAGSTASAAAANGVADISIVGLWDTQWQQLSPGPAAFFDEGYDQFHSDGTEILNDIPAPSTGNICLGVFVKTGRLSYALHHVFWTFDGSGNLIGRGEWDSKITVGQVRGQLQRNLDGKKLHPVRRAASNQSIPERCRHNGSVFSRVRSGSADARVRKREMGAFHAPISLCLRKEVSSSPPSRHCSRRCPPRAPRTFHRATGSAIRTDYSGSLPATPSHCPPCRCPG